MTFRALPDLLALLSKVKVGRGADPFEIVMLFWFLASLAWIALSGILWIYWIAALWLWPENDTNTQREMWLSFSTWTVLCLGAVMIAIHGWSKMRR